MSFVGNYLLNLGQMALRGEPSRPLLFSYYVTHQCQLNCRYCSDGDGKRFKEEPIPELETGEARRLVSILREAGDTLDITGGEPMLRGDLEQILAHAQAVGFRTILNTKGIGLADRPDLLRFTDVLVLSLDTLDPDALANLIGRPRPLAESILASLEHAMSASRRTGTRIVISAVATPENLEDVSRVLEFALQHGLGFHISPEIVGTQANALLRPNAQYQTLIDRVLELKGSRKGVLGVPEYLLGIRDFGRFRCHPLLMPVIRPDGRMYYPCLEWKKAEISLLETGSYREALRVARQRHGGLPDCRDCCHIFCHMALSLLQTHPVSAMRELRHWRN